MATAIRKAILTTITLAAAACGRAAIETPPETAAPGAAFRDCADCPSMMALPAGRFMMGSPEDEPGRNDSEGPQHEVDVKAFAIGVYAVTRGEWAAFAAATARPEARGCEWAGFPRSEIGKASWLTLGFEQDDAHPVVCVSWSDAQDYARWLSQRTGRAYRLPTEAEWEYAARGGTVTAYPWGAEASHEYANYGAEECCSELASGRDAWLFTAPVGSFPPNPFGLYDMQGNAWQWVEDCYAETYAAAPSDGSAYVAEDCPNRVLRGGTWGDTPAMIRAAFRNWAPPPAKYWNPDLDYRSGGVGLRVVREID